MSDRPIAIVGGGMVGLAAACLLARQRFEIELIDGGRPALWDPDQIGARVSAINVASQHLFEAIGVWESIQDKRAAPVRAMEVWDSHSDAHIRFDARDAGREALAWIVENDLVCREMQDRLSGNYSVSQRHETAVTSLTLGDEAASIGLSDGSDTIDADLVIAADGGLSTIRSLAGIEIEEVDFGQVAIVATIETERSHQDTAWQCFTPTGPVALLPFGDNRCSLVWSIDRDAALALNPEPAAIAAGLEELFAEHLGTIGVSGPVASFPLMQRHADRYTDRRLALVGDAAHTTHPLAGLGANIGLLDAGALAETISEAREQGRGPASHTALRRYARWRRGENALVLDAMRGFKTAFGADPSGAMGQFLAPLRSRGFAIADQTVSLKQRLAAHAMGMAGDLPQVCQPVRK